MANKAVEDALKRASAEQQARNQTAIEQSRQHIDGKTMVNTEEIATPKPKLGQPDPSGASRAKLDPATEERIEKIQKGGENYHEKTQTPEDSIQQKILRLFPNGECHAVTPVSEMTHTASPSPQLEPPSLPEPVPATTKDEQTHTIEHEH